MASSLRAFRRASRTMRFKFIGDADAPDWFIGEITILARIVRAA